MKNNERKGRLRRRLNCIMAASQEPKTEILDEGADMFLLRSTSAVLLVAAFSGPAHAKKETERPPAFLEVIHDLVKAKELVELQVARVKQSFKPSDVQYKDTEKLYGDALASCRSWTSAVKVAIIVGNRKDVPKDPIYRKWAAECGSSAQAVLDYAEKIFV